MTLEAGSPARDHGDTPGTWSIPTLALHPNRGSRGGPMTADAELAQ